MSSKMKLSRIKLLLFGLLTLFIIALLIVAYTDHKIQSLVREKRFLSPTQYYSSPDSFFVGQFRSPKSFQSYFENKDYRERPFGSPLQKGDYSLGNSQQCSSLTDETTEIFSCLLYRSNQQNELNLINLNELDQITSIFKGEDFLPSLVAHGEAELFAQYLGNKPTQQIQTDIGDIPRYCLDAIIAIEDPQFLEHSGFSPKGFIRAVLANIRKAGYSQGGSTITQQLVKNYFLSPEKTITRKLKEIIMALIFEFRVSKDDILETYLNIIYLGQSGVFEVRGYGSASEFYFQKRIDDLNLPECALLAAIVNNPGRYNPVRHPEKAKDRRERVLEKMVEHELISVSEKEEAQKSPLPTEIKPGLSASAPYYVDAVNKVLKSKGFEDRSGLSIYTALDPVAQNLAEKAVKDSIQSFETSFPSIVKIKKEQKLDLQAALLASNPITGEVVAIVGGRDFKTSPYNRAVESQRQVGSIIKPLVYLSALQNLTEGGLERNPMTLIDNSPLKLEYDRQVWEPRNYDGKFSAPLPMFYALKESKNIPTARLAMETGLDKVIETARNLGVTSKLKEYPSLALGAFELNPLEVLKVYNSLSQLGVKQELQIVKSIKNQKNEIVYEHDPLTEQVGNRDDYGVLIGMLKETLISGTGAFSRKMGFRHIAAGKTGTTSDTKDAWFAGFTPFHAAITWVGYDNGTPHNLTGASGALPIWSRYMREIAKIYSNRDFDFPSTVHKETISADDLLDLKIPEEKAKDTDLIFKNSSGIDD